MGKAIVLIGTSSVGKSSVAEQLQLLLPEPYLHVGIDQFFAMFPGRWAGRTTTPGPGFWYDASIDSDGHERARIRYGPVGERLLAGMRGAVNALLAAGNDLILDEMPVDPSIVPLWRRDLRAEAAMWVRLTAPLEVLEERERARQHGQVLGNARGHLRNAEGQPFDLTIATEGMTPREVASKVVDCWLRLSETGGD